MITTCGTYIRLEARSAAENSFAWPGKNEKVVRNSAKHMRMRCRTIRFAPAKPPSVIMRVSNAAHHRAIEPNTKYMAAGIPSFSAFGLPAA